MAEPSSSETIVRVPHLGIGGATEVLVEAAQRAGYGVAASGPGTFRLARSVRPGWALVLGIVLTPLVGVGLLVLRVRRRDDAIVSVFEDRDGTKVRVVGVLDEAVMAAITSRPPSVVRSGAAASVAAAPAVAVPLPPPAWGPVDRRGIIDVETPEPIDLPAASDPVTVRRDPQPSGADFAPPPPLFASFPKRPTVDSGRLRLRLPDGSVLDVGEGLVIGRDPLPPPGRGALTPVTWPDSSLSKTHLALAVSSSGVEVVDLHSTNGTSVETEGRMLACPPGKGVLVSVGSRIVAGTALFDLVEV